MNTPPDDNTLALWLDDELEGEELAQVEAWAANQPDQLAAREQVREWRKMIGDSIPAAEEPPAAEFFNERIQHAIREQESSPAAPSSRNSNRWNGMWMPLAACAGMVLAFWLGSLIQPSDGNTADSHSSQEKSNPHLYTPEKGVNAEWIASTDADATVIVLSGVTAIPDEVDFTAVALHRTWREIDSTASSESSSPEE